MEENLTGEKDDLAKAKKDLILRFVTDQERLQTGNTTPKSGNSDETFDIIDSIEIQKASLSNMQFDDNTPRKQNEHRLLSLYSNAAENRPRSRTNISNNRRSRIRGKSPVGLNDQFRREKIKKEVQGISYSALRKHENEFGRLRSAPSSQHKQKVHTKELNLPTKKAPLSVILSKKIDDRHEMTSLTCTNFKRPSKDISTVDIALLNQHTVPSITSAHTLMHLPPIPTDTTKKHPST